MPLVDGLGCPLPEPVRVTPLSPGEAAPQMGSWQGPIGSPDLNQLRPWPASPPQAQSQAAAGTCTSHIHKVPSSGIMASAALVSPHTPLHHAGSFLSLTRKSQPQRKGREYHCQAQVPCQRSLHSTLPPALPAICHWVLSGLHPSTPAESLSPTPRHQFQVQGLSRKLSREVLGFTRSLHPRRPRL